MGKPGNEIQEDSGGNVVALDVFTGNEGEPGMNRLLAKGVETRAREQTPDADESLPASDPLHLTHFLPS